MTQLAILASGSGSNAEQIIVHFKTNQQVKVGVIITNNPNAGVIKRAQKHQIPVEIIPNASWKKPALVLPIFKKYNIGFIALAGFLRKIPSFLLKAFPKKIINIHPSLLPKYGGKGMYGLYVHQAVYSAGESQTGITIHLVDEIYDNGEVIFQAKCSIQQEDQPIDIQQKVLSLEHKYYPIVIDYLASCGKQ